MPKVTEILVRREHHGQVWWELKPVEASDDLVRDDLEGKIGEGLARPPHMQSLPPKQVE